MRCHRAHIPVYIQLLFPQHAIKVRPKISIVLRYIAIFYLFHEKDTTSSHHFSMLSHYITTKKYNSITIRSFLKHHHFTRCYPEIHHFHGMFMGFSIYKPTIFGVPPKLRWSPALRGFAVCRGTAVPWGGLKPRGHRCSLFRNLYRYMFIWYVYIYIYINI